MRKPSDLLIWMLIGAVMLPWLYCAMQVSMNGDVAWLVHAAQRVMAGDAMTERFYDNNPPMSFMIYIPVTWIAAAGIKLWYAADLYTLLAALLSIGSVAFMLERAPGVQRHHFWLVIIGYIAAISFPARLELGQKDHLLAMALFPFLLAQFSLLERWPVRRGFAVVVMIAAVPFILVKPHYLLLPMLLILYRLRAKRRLGADSVIIAISAAIYAAIIWLRFPDFIGEALQASAKLYAAEIYGMVWPAVAGFGLTGACVLGAAVMIDRSAPVRRLCIFISAMALIAVVPVLLQFKGFSTHFLPPLALLLPAAFVTIGEITGRVSWRGWPVAILALVAGNILLPVPKAYPTHEAYKNSTLARVMEKEHSVYFQTGTTNVIEPLSVYTGTALATRFPSLWFMRGLQQNGDARMTESFRGDIAADFARYKPGLVALYARPEADENFLAFMKDDKSFRREWAHYKKREQITLSPAEYFSGTTYAAHPPIVYDVYRRQP